MPGVGVVALVGGWAVRHGWPEQGGYGTGVGHLAGAEERDRLEMRRVSQALRFCVVSEMVRLWPTTGLLGLWPTAGLLGLWPTSGLLGLWPTSGLLGLWPTSGRVSPDQQSTDWPGPSRSLTHVVPIFPDTTAIPVLSMPGAKKPTPVMLISVTGQVLYLYKNQ